MVLAWHVFKLFYESETQACASGLNTFRVWLHTAIVLGTQALQTLTQCNTAGAVNWSREKGRNFILHISSKL